ncbi:MAG: ABC transporter substrate-binding protein [Oscillospiraceae bacterium]|nr:ABC transporter substrate-binding protein [Oscillospiraceae bacterium]
MKKRFLLLFLLLLLTGCGGTQTAPLSCTPPESQRLVVYTSHKEEVYTPIIREFEERTGIWVEVVTGGTNELLQQIEKEQDAPRADVMFGGGVESLESYRDCFTPYICREADRIREGFQSQCGYWTPFSALPVVLIYNTKLVRAESVTSWVDLEKPAFRGNIAFADPQISGSSYTALVTRILAGGGEDCLSGFRAALEGRQSDSSGAVVSSVARGSALVGITLEETALQHISAGEDIALVYPADGTSCVPDGSALVKGAPHEENARRFLDFTVSEDVQSLVGQRFCRRAVRGDIPADPALPALSTLNLVDYDVEWASQNRDRLLSDWAFLLGEVAP